MITASVKALALCLLMQASFPLAVITFAVYLLILFYSLVLRRNTGGVPSLPYVRRPDTYTVLAPPILPICVDGRTLD